MEEYYRQRADEYEEIYGRDDPVRQREQRGIAEALRETFRGRNVIEIACGTGFWTYYLSETALRITGTDILEDVLEIAGRKQYGCPVTFCMADAYNLAFRDKVFGGGVAGFWFSHIPKDQIDSFIDGLHRILKDGAKVLMADNVYIPGIGGELVKREHDENTYKLRKLKDGSEYLVLKNYYTVAELTEIYSRHVSSFKMSNIFTGNCFWHLIYEVKGIETSPRQ